MMDITTSRGTFVPRWAISAGWQWSSSPLTKNLSTINATCATLTLSLPIARVRLFLG
jgi:hypothetical protein